MKAYSFHTIQSSGEGLYKESGNKFLAFAYPVESESAIKENLAALRKKYFDARHHCFAWMLGGDKKSFRAFDDGEPNHSAGDPILGQIRSRNITNVLIVVIRYFGGVKLGVGGLINAYRSAAEDALNATVIIEKEITEIISLNYDYVSTPEVMRLIKDFDLVVHTRDYANNCNIKIEYKLKYKDKIFEKIELLKATGSNLEIEGI